MAHTVRLSKTVLKPFLIWLCVILAVAGFSVYFAGPAYRSKTLVTEESQDLTIDPLGNALFTISEPESLFQTQLGYSNLTDLVLGQELRFSVTVANGTARISLVTLGLSNDIFKTIVPVQTLSVLDNVTLLSKSLGVTQARLVGLVLLNPGLQSIAISINGSRTLLVSEPDFSYPLTGLGFSLVALVCLHAYGVYRRKDPICVFTEFLKHKLMPRSYTEDTTRNRSCMPIFLLFSLLWIVLIAAVGFGPFFSVYEKAPEIYRPLVNLRSDLVLRISLTVYLAALSAYVVLVLVCDSLIIAYRARITARNDLGPAFAKYDVSSRPWGVLLIVFGISLWFAVLYFSWAGEYSQNMVWILLLSSPVWAILLDYIAITYSRRVSTEYLTIFGYELASFGIFTLVLAALPGVVGLVLSFEIWLSNLVVPPVYPVVGLRSLSDKVLQAWNLLTKNVLVLAVMPSLIFWCGRFFGFFLVDTRDREAYGKEAAFDMLVIVGVFLFGELLLSWIEPIGVESSIQALLLGLASNQVRYVFGKLR